MANNNDKKGEIIYSYYAYFISFIILTQICLLNIIFGFLIDNCQSYLVELLGKDIEDNEFEEI